MMIVHERPNTDRGGWQALRYLVLGLFLIPLSLGQLAFAGGSRGSTVSSGPGSSPDGDGGASCDDDFNEEVGSLPIRADLGGQDDDPDYRDMDGTRVTSFARPSLTLVGTRRELNAVIRDARGTGFVQVQSFGTDGVVITFHGEISVSLDAFALEASSVSILWNVGLEYGGGAVALEWNGRWTRPQPLPALGSLNVPFRRLLRSGLFDRGAARLRAVQPTGQSSSTLTIDASGHLFTLHQGHRPAAF